MAWCILVVAVCVEETSLSASLAAVLSLLSLQVVPSGSGVLPVTALAVLCICLRWRGCEWGCEGEPPLLSGKSSSVAVELRRTRSSSLALVNCSEGMSRIRA